MAGLVGYESSDDEADENKRPSLDAENHKFLCSHASAVLPVATDRSGPEPVSRGFGQVTSSETPQLGLPSVMGPIVQSAVALGPSLGPSLPSEDASTMEHYGYGQDETSASPYLTNRALIHDLTLPPVPDLDIPPSPAGSPPSGASKSFEQFLALKMKGTHFNAKLEQSVALRNPSIMDKLMAFVDLDGPKQYETTLSLDLWNPTIFPETAFVERLRKSQDTIAKEREADRLRGGRSSVDFVPSTSVGDGSLPATGGFSKAEKMRGDWK